MFDISGSWSLVSFSIEDELGSRNWGEDSHGILIYSPDGFMSVSINSTPTENPSDSILFYAGKYSLSANTVRHEVCNASDPARIGREMVREFKLENGILTLVARGEFGKAVLCWRKI